MRTPIKTGGISPENARGNGHTIEKSSVEARQGFRGKPVLYILLASLVLAIAAYLVLHIYFLGTLL